MSGPAISKPAYRIETKRLVLRCWQPEDAVLMQEAAAASKEHLLPFMPWAVHEPAPVEAKVELIRKFRASFDRGEDYVYGVFDQGETRVLGGSGLHTRIGEEGLEIGYWIHKDFINQGLMTEATAALVKVAFEFMHIHRLEIHCDPQNFASAAIPRKLGFAHEGTLRAKTRFLDGWSDSMIWGLLEGEYPHSPASKAGIKVFDAFGRRLL